jgi:hypothetical protein
MYLNLPYHLLASCTGAASASLLLSHWERLHVDPFFVPTTEEEREEWGEEGVGGAGGPLATHGTEYTYTHCSCRQSVKKSRLVSSRIMACRLDCPPGLWHTTWRLHCILLVLVPHAVHIIMHFLQPETGSACIVPASPRYQPCQEADRCGQEEERVAGGRESGQGSNQAAHTQAQCVVAEGLQGCRSLPRHCCCLDGQ